ncbi:MAG: hypothetical protein IT209_02425 [Armatimonadetes bacterium]|nr:hypothetical protein [Armatimonadota bacterium]
MDTKCTPVVQRKPLAHLLFGVRFFFITLFVYISPDVPTWSQWAKDAPIQCADALLCTGEALFHRYG